MALWSCRSRLGQGTNGRTAVGTLNEQKVAIASNIAVEPADPAPWAELYQELDSLPEKYRLPLVLCDLNGLTYEQAATRLKCPVRTVQTRLARGRQRLRRRLRAAVSLHRPSLLGSIFSTEVVSLTRSRLAQGSHGPGRDAARQFQGGCRRRVPGGRCPHKGGISRDAPGQNQSHSEAHGARRSDRSRRLDRLVQDRFCPTRVAGGSDRCRGGGFRRCALGTRRRGQTGRAVSPHGFCAGREDRRARCRRPGPGRPRVEGFVDDSREAVTDADGRYSIALPAGNANAFLSILPPGYWLPDATKLRQSIAVTPGHPIHRIDYTVRRGTVWTFRLTRGPKQEPLRGGTILRGARRSTQDGRQRPGPGHSQE